MELLAPAGNIENFVVALQAGADAVYVGAPGINARNLSRDLRLEEIWAMIEYAHARNRKVYIAANSLILERDLSGLLDTLCLLEEFQPDALIIQDLALIQLISAHFPNLHIHASTLMGCSNSDAVDLFAALGCKRVVLARELTLKEINEIASRAEIPLEVFVHGAMCYSYSGLCLFSSYHGGKSGLRGRCVQPCRRGYSWKGGGGRKKGKKPHSGGGSYLFSMNDLAGFEAVTELKRAGITSLKIEGRLRSANYVGKIVEAYRTVLDAGDNERQQALISAAGLAEEAMGRKTSPGYFFSPQPQGAITPHHSGNTGLHLGSLSDVVSENNKLLGRITPKYGIKTGDRLRLHIERTGERKGFTLHHMQRGNNEIETAAAGTTVQISLPQEQKSITTSRVELFKLDDGDRRTTIDSLAGPIATFRKKRIELGKQQSGRRNRLRSRVTGHNSPKDRADLGRKTTAKKGKAAAVPKGGMELWLRTDSAQMVITRLPFIVDVYLLNIDRKMLSQSATFKKVLGKRSRNIVWALPPMLMGRDLQRYAKQIHQLIRSGYRSFQIGHISQISLFRGEHVHLYGDYTLNLANSQALKGLGRLGVDGTQVSAELDRSGYSALLAGYSDNLSEERGLRMRLGITVYGAPPLFTSRLSSDHFQFNKTFVSPKGEEFQLKKKEGMAVTVPLRPFSLLPFIDELQDMGFDYGVVDITSMRMTAKDLQELTERLAATGKVPKLPTFNYLGSLE